MKKVLEKLSEFDKSVLLSVTFHVILLMLFLLIRSGLDLPEQEFAEIGFVAATTSRASRPAIPPKTRAVQTEAEQPAESTPPSPAAVQPPKEAAAPPVNLPERRMLEEEEPEITRRQSGKLTPKQDDSKLTPHEDVYDSDAMRKEVAERGSDGKAFSEPLESTETGKTASPASDVGVNTNTQPYTLEGDASKRTILKQILPEYPSGLQREAVVKIRFWVLPDGRIGAMIPVQKGDPTLEEITMKAIRQWRFSALPPDEEQRNVEGIITFVYKLE
ncbi:energy transducer TonB [candidate division KSB1 bacterium]|nr:energy transducer TonB [candidate division KSB1 bacterium]